MLLWIWVRDDASGILDDEFRDGDVFMVKPDSFEPSIGEQETKSWLIIKIPDPPNMAVVSQSLVESEYAVGMNNEPVIRRARKYRLDWRPRFTAEEVEIIIDAAQTLGIVANRFTIKDFSRK